VTDVAEADYLLMVLKKTCWLATIHPSRMGALIGSAGALNLDACIRFGFFLGAAFQIQDDLLNLEGDAEAYGKELGGDIREGKRTLMLIHLLSHATKAERERLHKLLGQPRECRTDREVSWVRQRMDAYGSLNYARQVAQGLAGAAQFEFDELYGRLPDSRDKRFLQALPAWVIERN
jgi:geranylgeranyl diphosphate synthase type II